MYLDRINRIENLKEILIEQKLDEEQCMLESNETNQSCQNDYQKQRDQMVSDMNEQEVNFIFVEEVKGMLNSLQKEYDSNVNSVEPL